MKHLHIILLISFGVYAQKPESLKLQDTIYIIVNNDIKNKEFDNFKYEVDSNKAVIDYAFSEKAENRAILIRVKNQNNYQFIKRKDLNKKNLLDFKLLEEYGLNHIFNITLKINTQKKAVYIIEEKDLKNKKVKMKKARAAAVGYNEM